MRQVNACCAILRTVRRPVRNIPFLPPGVACAWRSYGLIRAPVNELIGSLRTAPSPPTDPEHGVTYLQVHSVTLKPSALIVRLRPPGADRQDHIFFRATAFRRSDTYEHRLFRAPTRREHQRGRGERWLHVRCVGTTTTNRSRWCEMATVIRLTASNVQSRRLHRVATYVASPLSATVSRRRATTSAVSTAPTRRVLVDCATVFRSHDLQHR